MNGWIKIHRELLDHWVFADAYALKVWVWLLSKARTEPGYLPITIGRGQTTVKLERGQLLFGRFKAEEALGMDGSRIYRLMGRMADDQMITVESNSHYSLVTICNYDTYQSIVNENEQPLNNQRTANEQPMNSKRTAVEQPLNTKEELKNYKNIEELKELKEEDTIVTGKPVPTPPVPFEKIVNAYNTICTNLTKCTVVSEGRKKKIRARFAELKSLERFEEIFIRAAKTGFLNGKNEKGWKASFDWLMENDTNYLKMMEGKYDKPEKSVEITDPNRYKKEGGFGTL